jgi:hypothetical protein
MSSAATLANVTGSVGVTPNNNDARKRVIASELGGDQTVLGVHRVVLAFGATHFELRLSERELKVTALLVALARVCADRRRYGGDGREAR